MSDVKEFVNFDGQLTGEVARIIKESAARAGWTPQFLIRQILADALSDELNMDASGSVKVESLTAVADAVGVTIPRPTQSSDVLLTRVVLPE